MFSYLCFVFHFSEIKYHEKNPPKTLKLGLLVNKEFDITEFEII